MKELTLYYRLVSCNQKCKHCYIPIKSEMKMKDISKIKNIIDQMAEINNSGLVENNNALLYFHDEPTIHPQIVNILDYMLEKKVKYNCALATNGYGLIRKQNGLEILNKFKKCGASIIHMSLFGNREYHDTFTGRQGSYDDIISSIEMAKENNMDTHINLFAFKDNIDMINEIFKNYKDCWITLSHVAYSEKLQYGTKYRLSANNWQKINSDLKKTMYSVLKTQKEWLRYVIEKKQKLIKNIEEEYKNQKKYSYLIELDNKILDLNLCEEKY